MAEQKTKEKKETNDVARRSIQEGKGKVGQVGTELHVESVLTEIYIFQGSFQDLDTSCTQRLPSVSSSSSHESGENSRSGDHQQRRGYLLEKSEEIDLVMCRDVNHTHHHKICRENIGIAWKRKLTSVLHDKYFSGHNFYHVETELVDPQTKKPTNDADSRMTEEVEKVVEGYASFLSAGLFNICSGTFYLAKLWNEYGFLYAGLPFGYIFAATALAHTIAPLSYRKYRELLDPRHSIEMVRHVLWYTRKLWHR